MIEMYFLVIDMEIIQCYRYRTNLKSRKFVPFSNNLAQFRPKLATLLGKNWTLLTITVVRFGSKWVKLAKNGRNPGFFQIRFSTFWLGEPKCTESGLKKIPGLTLLGANLTQCGCQIWHPCHQHSALALVITSIRARIISLSFFVSSYFTVFLLLYYLLKKSVALSIYFTVNCKCHLLVIYSCSILVNHMWKLRWYYWKFPFHFTCESKFDFV